MTDPVKKVAPKATTAAVKAVVEAPKAKLQSDVVKVKNICKKVIYTSQGTIKAGKEGKATVAELRQLNRFIKEL